MALRVLILITIFVASCNSLDGIKEYCSFDYSRLQPSNNCNDDVRRVKAHYFNNRLRFVEFFHEGHIIESDSFISRKSGDFLIENIVLQNEFKDSVLFVSAKFGTDVKGFVFVQEDGIYTLAFLEAPQGDSVVRIDLINTSDFKFPMLSGTILDSLENYKKYIRTYAIFHELKYQYEKGQMYFKVIDVYPDWRAERENVDTLINSVGNIFIDQKLIVEKMLLPNYLQLKATNRTD